MFHKEHNVRIKAFTLLKHSAIRLENKADMIQCNPRINTVFIVLRPFYTEYLSSFSPSVILLRMSELI